MVDLRGNSRFTFDLYDRLDEVVQTLASFTGIWSGPHDAIREGR